MPVELLRANEAFKGIKVPAGEHRIEFSYHPPGGTWVYIAATAVLFIFLLWTMFMLYWRALMHQENLGAQYCLVGFIGFAFVVKRQLALVHHRTRQIFAGDFL